MPFNCVIYLFIGIFATSASGKNVDLLQRLLDLDAKPIILVVKGNVHSSTEDSDERKLAYSSDNNNFNFISKKDIGFKTPGVFYAKRAIPQEVLRDALRARCRRVNNCKRRCPRSSKRTTITCTIQCETRYDKGDLCKKESLEDSCDEKCARTLLDQ